MGILIKSSSLAAILRKSKRQPTRILRLMHVVHQQFKESLKRDKESICFVKDVLPESSDEETVPMISSSKLLMEELFTTDELHFSTVHGKKGSLPALDGETMDAILCKLLIL